MISDSPVGQRAAPAQRVRERCRRCARARAARAPAAGPRTCAASVPASAAVCASAPASKNVSCPIGSCGSACFQLLQAVDSDRLQIVAQHRLDGALPARLHIERLGQPRLPGRRRQSGQPGAGARILLAQRRLLQGFQRHQLGARLLALVPQPLEASVCGLLRSAQQLHLLHQRAASSLRERLGERCAPAASRSVSPPSADSAACAANVSLSRAQAVGLRLQAVPLALQLLDARGLDLGALSGRTELAIEAPPSAAASSARSASSCASALGAALLLGAAALEPAARARRSRRAAPRAAARRARSAR